MKVMQVVKKIVSWLAVLAGLCVSMFSFGLFGMLPLTGSYGPPTLQTWFGALTFVCSGVTAAAASLIAFRNRKLASLLCLIAAPLAALGAWFSQMIVLDALYPIFPYQHSTVASLATVFGPPILLGLFWAIAHRYHWPHITAGRKLPRWAKFALGAAASALFLVCVCATSVRIVQLETDSIDCGGPPPFSKPYPHRAVFIARVVHFDYITGAMAIVQERFGGIPRWNKIVFLKYVLHKGAWFVDGRVEDGIITRWLVPVFDLKCTGSAPIQDAGVELRLFRDSPHWEGVRIIGTVRKRPLAGGMASGVTVIIDGPSGSTVTTTDHDGIYDVSGLPPGHYSIRVPSSRRHGACQVYGEQGLEPGDVWGCELFDW
jgi:hypothetical protein